MKKIIAMLLCLAVTACTFSLTGVCAYAGDTEATVSEEAAPQDSGITGDTEEEAAPEGEYGKTDESSNQGNSEESSYSKRLAKLLATGAHDTVVGPLWLVASPVLSVFSIFIPYAGWIGMAFGVAGFVGGPVMFVKGIGEIVLAPILSAS